MRGKRDASAAAPACDRGRARRPPLERVEGRAAGTLLAQQATLDLAYAQYRTSERAAALATLDRFIKLNPSSPALDYAYYLRGIVNFNDNLGILGWLAQQDLATAVGVSPAQMSSLVEGLRKRGLMEMKRSPVDRRRQVWQLLAQGPPIISKIAKSIHLKLEKGTR